MTTDAGLLGSSAVNGIASILNAQNSYSQGYGFEDASSWGSSSAKSFDNLDAWSLGGSWSTGDSESSSTSSQTSTSRTYGREASAADIQRAAEANQIQRDLWSEQAEYNAKQAEIDREFQKEMSNTAYQRAVKDLILAGLNPILAVGNMGASTPVGAMATSGLAASHKATTFPESESYSYGSSSSSSWSKDRAKSQNASKTTGRAASESYSSQGSSSHSENRNRSKTTTQLNDVLNFGKDQIALLDKMLNAGSGKDVSKTYGAKSGGGGGGGAY